MTFAALMPLGGAVLTIATAYAAGSILIARLKIPLRRLEKLPLTFVLGAACLHLLIFAIFALKIAYKPVFLIVSVCLIAAYLWRREKSQPQPFSKQKIGQAILYAAIFLTFSVLYFVNAWAPEASPDGSGYHLEFVVRYLDAHGFIPIASNLYAGFGQGTEMLFAMAVAFGGHSAAALMHLSFAIALALAMLAYGFRIGKWWVGAGAALLVYLCPLVGKEASSAYIDIASAAIGFAVFYWLEIWDDGRDDRVLIAVGLLSGYAFATKYTGGVMIAYALAFVIWKNRSWKPLAIVSVAAALMILPWMAKDWIYLGDPVAPIGAAIFRNPNAHISMVEDFAIYTRTHGIENKWQVPLGLTLHGGAVEGLLGPVFLAAPLALLALRSRAGRRLLLAAAVTLLPCIVNLHARFLLPALPFISMAILLPLSQTPLWIAAMVMFHAVASWPTAMRSYADPTAWRILHFPWAAAVRRESEDGFLRRTLPGYAEARLVEEHVPKGGRVLALSTIATSYTSREILVGYQAALNQVLSDGLAMGWDEDAQPRVAITFRFPERPVHRIRIRQMVQHAGREQWSVHELRYLRGGVELQRSSAWRLRAWPNPWDVQLAFDGSPTTRWRTWETAAPGMFNETDFGSDQTIDEVRIETSKDDQKNELQVEAMDAAGGWVRVESNPVVSEIKVRESFRRAATYELRARGVEYLLIQDRDYGAADFEEDPASWNLAVVARIRSATLYRVLP